MQVMTESHKLWLVQYMPTTTGTFCFDSQITKNHDFHQFFTMDWEKSTGMHSQQPSPRCLVNLDVRSLRKVVLSMFHNSHGPRRKNQSAERGQITTS